MKVRRSGVLLVTTGLACLTGAALPLFPATADAGDPGSGLGSFSLSANAPVLQVQEYYPQSNCTADPAGLGACEGDLTESVSTMRNGPVGHALASVGWPGTLGGGLGTLLIVAGGAPDQVTALNDPVKAENNISGPDDTVSNNQVPGAEMTATTTDTSVSATAALGQAQSTPVGSFGRVLGTTKTALTGVSKAEATAHSEVANISIGGVITIKSVVSDAHATTDGTLAAPSGKTTVTGISIAGVPVTVDEHGVTVQTQSVALPSQATDAVNSALKQAGMTVVMSAPNIVKDGAKAVVNAGSLVIVWNQQPGMSTSLMLGGAQVSVTSTPGYDDSVDTGDSTGPTTPTRGDTSQPATGGTSGVPTFTDGGTLPVTTGGDTGPLPQSDPGTFGGVPTASRLALPHGLSPWYGVLALLGAGLVMAGLRRLPDRLLAVPATACPLGENA